MAETSNGSKKPSNSRGSTAKKGSLSPAELQTQLERSQNNLGPANQTQTLVSTAEELNQFKQNSTTCMTH